MLKGGESGDGRSGASERPRGGAAAARWRSRGVLVAALRTAESRLASAKVTGTVKPVPWFPGPAPRSRAEVGGHLGRLDASASDSGHSVKLCPRKPIISVDTHCCLQDNARSCACDVFNTGQMTGV